jgi:hypothetical protein
MCHTKSEVQEVRQSLNSNTFYLRTTTFILSSRQSFGVLFSKDVIAHRTLQQLTRSTTFTMNSTPSGHVKRVSSLYASDMSSVTRFSSETIESTTKAQSEPPVSSLLSPTVVWNGKTELTEKCTPPRSDELQAPESTVTPITVGSSNSVSKSKQSPPIPTLIAFVALCLSVFLVALDTVLIPTALPTIALSFHIRDSLYAWIGSAYLLANAASVPFWGKFSDIFGRKPVIMAANMIFLVGSIVCALSMNASMLVAGRVVQGFGGGGVVVLVHVCVSDLFSIR